MPENIKLSQDVTFASLSLTQPLLRAIEDAGIAVYDVGLRRPTLDDVFLTLTGHHAEAATGPIPGEVTT